MPFQLQVSISLRSREINIFLMAALPDSHYTPLTLHLISSSTTVSFILRILAWHQSIVHLAQISSAELTFFQVQVQKLIKKIIKNRRCSLLVQQTLHFLNLMSRSNYRIRSQEKNGQKISTYNQINRSSHI